MNQSQSHLNLTSLRGDLDWFADRVGVQLLAVANDARNGFSSVTAEQFAGFYGIFPAPTFDTDQLFDPPNFEDAVARGIISPDFPQNLWLRSLGIARTMQRQSCDQGFEFYNGHLARLVGVDVLSGRSNLDSRLCIRLGHTSFFTALGTNFYSDEYLTLEGEVFPPIDESMKWASNTHGTTLSPASPLANSLGVHIVLYNTNEIFYVQRGRVGINSGCFNSTVNGAVELDSDTIPPDIIPRTAIREIQAELSLDIEAQSIKWLACVASRATCQPAVIGACEISPSMSELLRSSAVAQESREISDVSSWHSPLATQKVIRSIARTFSAAFYQLTIGSFSFPIPISLRLPARLHTILSRKVLSSDSTRTAKARGHYQSEDWNRIGAIALLLTLSHLAPPSALSKVTSAIRRSKQKDS